MIIPQRKANSKLRNNWVLHFNIFSTNRLKRNRTSGFTYSYGLIPSVLMGIDELPNDLYRISPIGTIFTSMFMHGGGCI